MAAPSPRHGEDGAFFVGSARVYGCFISVYDEKRGFFFNFLADGLHDWGILLSIPLEFQEIKHQPLPMAQPFCFGCVIGGTDSSLQYDESTAFFSNFFCWRTLWLRHFIDGCVIENG